MPTIKAHKPTERASQIIKLAKQALAGAEDVRQRIRLSTDAAIQCGKLLLKERAHVHKTFGRTSWESYFEITFSKTLPRSTAWHWMKQASSPIGQVGTKRPRNELRNSILTLELFPPKENAPLRVAGQAAINTPPLSTHLSLINRFAAWHEWLMKETGGTQTDEQAAQLLTDFAPIERFLTSLKQQIASHP